MSGWDASAAAWIAAVGEAGDWTRRHVLDGPMLEGLAGHRLALDVGCGEGRFCRMLAAAGVQPVGLDPTAALVARAAARHPSGHYVRGHAEALPFSTGTFDLVVSYLSLIDIGDLDAAVGQMARVLAPGGLLRIANLNPWQTAAMPDGWGDGPDGRRTLAIAGYLDERSEWVRWDGIRILNWHRPMERYMAALLGNGLTLVRYAEPAPSGGDPARVARYRTLPYVHLMDWRAPG